MTKFNRFPRATLKTGSAKRLTRAIGGTFLREPNMVDRYNLG